MRRKALSAHPNASGLFTEPFRTKWVFDVEIIARYLCATAGSADSPAETIYELPLESWHDTANSKVKPWDFARALYDLALIYGRYRGRWRRSGRPRG